VCNYFHNVIGILPHGFVDTGLLAYVFWMF
jgi:hypothetical protein